MSGQRSTPEFKGSTACIQKLMNMNCSR